MKKLVLLTSVVAASATLSAAPLITIGDEVDVFFTGSFIGKWTSNLYWSENKVDDYVYTFRLGAEANYGRNSKFKASVKFYEDINTYLQQTQQNNNLANVFANATYTEDRWFVAANFSFQQLAQNTDTTTNTDTLVRSDKYAASVNGSYSFTDKISADLGFYWYEQNYVEEFADQYSDIDVYRVPVSLLYKVTDKISAGLTYQYRYSEYTGGSAVSAVRFGSETTDHFVGITIRGELFPKLSAETFFGYSLRELNNADSTDDSTFAFSVKLNYLLTDKVSLFLKSGRDFGNGASRQSSTITYVEAGADYAFSQYVSSYASLRFANSAYLASPRDDDNYSANVGINYNPTRYLSVGATYSYQNNASNLVGCSYMAHLVSIRVDVKY